MKIVEHLSLQGVLDLKTKAVSPSPQKMKIKMVYVYIQQPRVHFNGQRVSFVNQHTRKIYWLPLKNLSAPPQDHDFSQSYLVGGIHTHTHRARPKTHQVLSGTQQLANIHHTPFEEGEV